MSLLRIMDVATAEATILRRAAWDEWQVPDAMLDKNIALFGERIGPDEAVRRILADVRHRGDAALVEWTERLDRVKPQALVLTEKHIQDAYAQVSAALVEAMTLASERI
ncbi:MAG: histidinol dehydrogenase, partial [Caldilineaceae bacterium]|nr:histidinol dehydrogenase [Caldilineaceae bacterium]